MFCKKLLPVIYLLIIVSLAPMISNAQTSKKIVLTNPANLERTDELVVLSRTDLESRVGSISKFITIKKGNQSLYLQFDDLNNDGKWDEAVFHYSFKPLEKVTFDISLSNSTEVSPAARAHVHLRKKNADDTWQPSIANEEMPLRNPPTDFSKQPLPMYLTEGPGWENDKVGFRLYFDTRNGKDIWGKRTSRMVLDSVGTKVEPLYHDLHDWGMDILHVGKSLGAGSLALLVPMAGEDSLVRLGGNDIKHTEYSRLTNGPLRAIFQLKYDWVINEKSVQVIEQISIWGGQYFYESKVWVKGAPAGTKLVTGIANFYDNVFKTYDANGANIIFSYGAQSENKDNLGMAVLVPQNFSFAGTTPNSNSDVLNTYYSAQTINESKPCQFRFVSAWEKTDSRFASMKYFEQFLNHEAIKMKSKITLEWQ